MNLLKRVISRIRWAAIYTISAICPNDRLVLKIARAIAMWDKPRAQRHFDHYLRGRGQEILVDTQALFDEDPGVFSEFYADLNQRLKSGAKDGKIAIPQWSYLNHDWLYALGGIYIDWALERNHISAWFISRYRWHPHEPRLTKPIHRAAENLKRFGAQEFDVIGSKVKLNPSEISISYVRRKEDSHLDFNLL